MNVARFKIVIMFLVAWLMAAIFWTFLLKSSLIHRADHPAVQGLAGVTPVT